ncbi:uncharacterized protein VDAG_03831 [Verticillium dahliae VdLs.17]|uniref:Uncharacterized protein n=1 Tax=Verticillium dahliae (strain VdLs.17 / ATCC MYA-4575 / FGSC 10137) TaxID=498257 RepID=G2X0Q2_VERDV|nr:uncharacterized protein VDAG_03831 [Verticillium dahliae VdLs.17]EGY22393.1 hypothetical protein VDAG_03831 [Verticillium dahliae VdLs.17]
MPTNLPRPCSQCICRLRLRSLATRSPPLRLLSSASQHKPSKDPSATASEATASEANASEKPGNEAPAAAPQDDPPAVDTLPGALSRRLEQATEEAMTGSTSGFRAVATEAGFSPALKDRLFEKVQAATFQDAQGHPCAEAGAQEGIVTPWIEKQQEVVREVAAFRARLRGDWARHAARMIAASGGDVTAQAARADGFAAAEARVNPRRRKDEAAAAAQGAAPVEASAEHVGAIFRDPAWEAAERSYLTLSVETLNSLTRSYNLMAPELAKKPYYSLERELKACYADVAPLLPDMIRDRGLRPARSLLAEGQGAPRPPSMFAQLGGEGHARVYDNKAPRYGFKEMWRDIWGAKKA